MENLAARVIGVDVTLATIGGASIGSAPLSVSVVSRGDAGRSAACHPLHAPQPLPPAGRRVAETLASRRLGHAVRAPPVRRLRRAAPGTHARYVSVAMSDGVV